jgi:hypothetical protein
MNVLVEPGPDVDAAPSALAVALAPLVQVWRSLLAEHVPDRDGRCAACRWQTRLADRWPCNLYVVSAAARRVARARQGSGL